MADFIVYEEQEQEKGQALSLSTILPFDHIGRATGSRPLALAALMAVAASAAHAAPVSDPTGEWTVEKGYATIRIVDCNGQIWGVVASEQTPGTDKNNPDPRLRNRPTLGMPVLIGMKPTKPNVWSGDIYNSQDGRTYSASISLLSPDVLKVQGCVLGFLCGGENWARVVPTPTQRPGGSGTKPTSAVKPAAGARPVGSAGNAPAPQPPSPQTQTSEEICSALVGLPGGAHERRLK